MPVVESKLNGQKFVVCGDGDGLEVFQAIMEANPFGGLSHLIIDGFTFRNVTDTIASISNTTFKNCVFKDCDLRYFDFQNTDLQGCKMTGDVKWWVDKTGLEYEGKEKELLKNMPTNAEIQERFGCKCYSLPNKAYVKVEWVCDFCHKHTFEIYRRDRVQKVLCDVPNCDKKVCSKCYSAYRINEKFAGNRTYGYRGDIHKYKTPMDKSNTAILGLEMEFEGDFFGWKELEDAHQGMLHYGYDSSVIGQNELSWDCGSYSWWKYLSTLKPVCQVLGKYGGKAGDSAGIHIHVSRPDVDMRMITASINEFGQSVVGGALFKAVSLRNNMEKFNTYSSLSSSEGAHHAAISYNSYHTCEFRIFNSTLDYQIILKHLKFCKEVFNAFCDGKCLWDSFSPETVAHIKTCAKIQLDKGFITDAEYKSVIKKITK